MYEGGRECVCAYMHSRCVVILSLGAGGFVLMQDPANALGRGGSGAVYRGHYRRTPVAVKEFLTSSQAEHTGDTQDGQSTYHTEEEEMTRQDEALFLFR